jgi:hypothetical protein
MRFLTSAAGYRGTYTNIKSDIRQDLKIFILGETVKEHQQNYSEHILRMPTYRIPWKIFGYHPKGR